MTASRTASLLLALMLLLGAACGDAATTTTVPPPPAPSTVTSAAPVTTAGPTPTTSTTQAPTTSAPTPPAAASPVRGQIEWILSVLNGADLTAEDFAERFDDTFRSQITAEQLIAILRGIGAEGDGEFAIVETLGESETQAAVLLGAPGLDEQLEMSILVAAAPPHLIGTLFFRPAAALDEVPESFEQLAGQLAGLASGSAFLAAELVDGSCRTTYASGGDDVVPLGSTFKLYVLGALAAEIAAGDLSWGDELAIRDELKSLPSGIMQDEPAGSRFSLLEFATLMISISDNTATDHLIDLLGREAVEAAQAALGHHDPSLNIPFLTTRDLFQLKAGLTDEEVEEYLSLDTDARRAFLDGDIAGRSLEGLDITAFTAPRFIDTLEWFATPNDLCRAFAGLAEVAPAAGPEELRGILEIGTGTLDPSEWSYVGFKGGSEPGVLVLAYLAVRQDGRTFVQVIALNDPGQLVDERIPSLLAVEGFQLLAAVP